MSALLPSAAVSGGKPLDLRDHLERRLSAMKLERGSFDAQIRDIADHMRPMRTRFTQTKTNKGDRRNYSIVDNTPLISARVCTSGVNSGMASPARPWFKYESEDTNLMEVGAVKAWLNQLEGLSRRILHASNAYNALPTVIDELVLFATGCAIIDDDFENVIHMHPLSFGEYYLALNEKRQVDTLYRELRMTVRQCVRQFGTKNLSSTTKTQWDNSNYDQWVDVYHAIEPNKERDAGKLDNQNMPFRSVYWEKADEDRSKFLRKSGYQVNPIMAPRWDVIGNDVYGMGSPGMNAIGDARALQIQHKRLGEAIEKVVNPPTQMPPAAADRYVSLLPGARNVVADTANGGIKPIYETRPDIAAMVEHIADTRERIRQAFFVRDFLPISNMHGVQPKNQFELAERKAEGLLVLGPVVERLNNELFNPLHDRIIDRIAEVSRPFWEMGMPGMLPPPPPELQGMGLNINYISTLAQVQKGVAISGIEQYANFAAGLMKAGFANAALKFDEEQAMDEYADMLGIPVAVVRSDEAVAAMKQAMADQQAAAQAAAAAPAVADLAGAAKDLSETNVGGGVGALEAMLGNAANAA